jgi:hypothetical protein
MKIRLLPKGFRVFWKNKINRLLILLIVIFVGLASIFYLLAGKRTEASLVDQMLHREQIVVRAGARSISAFLELSGNSLTLLAKDYCVTDTSKDTQTVLDGFITEWEETSLVEVVLIDEEGVVQFVANKAKTPLEPGVSITDRDYFIAAKKALPGEVFVGKPFLPRIGAFKGQYLLPLSTPIIVDGERRGVLGAGILLSELTKNYLDPLRISEDTQIYLLNQEGIFLHSYYPELVGKNVIEYLEENSYPGSDKIIDWFEGKLAEPEEGKYVFPMQNLNNKNEIKNYLLAYTPFSLGERHFILAVATPQKDALAFFPPFYGNQIGTLVFTIFMVLAFSALLILAIRMAERDGYLHGFKNGRSHRKKQSS